MTTVIKEPGQDVQVFIDVPMHRIPEWSVAAIVYRYWSEKHPCGWAGGFLRKVYPT